MTRVYLDHNATTPLRPEARALLLDRLDRLAGNPSSVHHAGREARAWLDEARERAAAALGVHEDEIVFTGGGTEAIHLALLGAMRARGPDSAVVTTAIEHSAVLGIGEVLAAGDASSTSSTSAASAASSTSSSSTSSASSPTPAGHPRPPQAAAAPSGPASATRFHAVGVDREGVVDVEALIDAARARPTAVVSVQAANNEIGTLQPLATVAARLADLGNSRPLLHTDAVQAVGRVPFRPRHLPVDLASISAHKFGGPLGVGLLYKRKGVTLVPTTQGGGQESGLRPGTENVPAICAAALALELAVAEQADYARRTCELSRSFWEQLRAVLPRTELHGPPIDADTRLPNTLNVALANADGRAIDGRVLVARLDLEGLEVSAGSACASGSLEPSHVLVALGHANDRARAAIRVSLGRTTSSTDIHTAVDILRTTFLALR